MQDARYKMQDAGWHGNVIQLRDYFAELSLAELAEGILEDNTLKSLKLNKEILVADAYKNMVHGHEDPLVIQAIKEYGELSVKILKKLFET